MSKFCDFVWAWFEPSEHMRQAYRAHAAAKAAQAAATAAAQVRVRGMVGCGFLTAPHLIKRSVFR